MVEGVPKQAGRSQPAVGLMELCRAGNHLDRMTGREGGEVVTGGRLLELVPARKRSLSLGRAKVGRD
jgi:hypothetical protein